MKELSVQEKAKAYDKAVESLRAAFYDDNNRMCEEYRDACKKIIEPIFPELAESEDERIRKCISLCLEECMYKDIIRDYERDECLSWLEKRGEQKQDVNMQINPSEYINDMGGNGCYLKNATQIPTDKVEPKFKVGDWVVSPNGVYWHVDAIRDGRYQVSSNSGECTDWSLDTNIYHRFTIQDAKDGDVLVDGNLPFIFKNIDTNKYSYAYCGISVDDGFKIESDGEFGEWTWMQDIKPATKEQRDLLFQKMKEAGYEWNADKKELKKIEQKTAWSEKDDYNAERLLCLLTNEQDNYPQSSCDFQYIEGIKDWLKSLKDRYSWKPSGEQMEAIKDAIEFLGCTKKVRENLKSLYEQLKKLKG